MTPGAELPLMKDGKPIWCVDEEKPATNSCAFGQHRMAIEEDITEAAEYEARRQQEQPAFMLVLAELAEERRRQRNDHGWTAAHDDGLSPAQWVWLLNQRTTTLLAPSVTPKDARRCLVELAAIATAAVEASDRARERQGF